MGLPPVPLGQVRSYIKMVRSLLQGEEVMYRDGKHERVIRFLHPHHGYINLRDQIPVYLAADGPKALELVGELADGWVTVLSGPERFREKFESVKKGAQRAGRSVENLPNAVLTSGCILRDGESATSARVIERMGPFAIVFLHALWEQSAVAAALPATLTKLWERYRDEYVAKMKTPADKRYLEVHEGHLIYLKPGEEKYVDDALVRSMTLTGRGNEIIARLKALEAAGVKQVAIQVVWPHGREMIEDFSREVIAKY
jgi:alkanesulfonate monooxygenase SsuD/methylene tetrahydromethanopterin reductase-like flavin-dependent oxidoreductase (luciferase family)